MIQYPGGITLLQVFGKMDRAKICMNFAKIFVHSFPQAATSTVLPSLANQMLIYQFKVHSFPVIYVKVTVNVFDTKFGFRSLKAELLTESR